MGRHNRKSVYCVYCIVVGGWDVGPPIVAILCQLQIQRISSLAYIQRLSTLFGDGIYAVDNCLFVTTRDDEGVLSTLILLDDCHVKSFPPSSDS